MAEYKINTSDLSILENLKAGDTVILSGVIYTLRDAGHKRLVESYRNGKPDFDISGKVIYYCGPTPTLENEIIGSCGPTTSSRMDDYTPFLIRKGLKIMIGKGKRSDLVLSAMKDYGAVYLIAVGGAGALYKSVVKANEPVIYDDLGCEAMRALTVENMRLMVGADARGNTILA
jgi:fumarate hydratase subunit beta